MADALPNPPPRPDWLARHHEPAIDPDRPIVDPHHHLWDVAHPRYLLDEYAADIAAGGHRVVASVFVEAEAMLRADGPAALRPVGEAEFANGIAAMSASGLYGPTRVCAGIVAHADLSLGDAVEPVLDALERAGGGRLRGVRHCSAHDPAVRVRWPAGLLRQPAFADGFARLIRRGLSFDAWMYHPQLPDLIDLLQRFPEAPVVLNHAGGRIGIGGHAGPAGEGAWLDAMQRLAAFPNLHVKLGGLGMALAGHGFHAAAEPPDSVILAAAWGPRLRTCIDLFGPERCMFESNFPVDKAACSYGVLWNAFKRIAAPYDEAARHRLFLGTAARFYRLVV